MYFPRPFLAALLNAVLPPLMATQVVFASSLAEQMSGVLIFAVFCLFFQIMLPRTPPWDRWIILVSGVAMGMAIFAQTGLPIGTWSDAFVGLLVSLPIGVFCLLVTRQQLTGMVKLHLHSPVSGGRFLVIQGGASRFLNHHLKCLHVPDLRGQSYGVDIVAAGLLGLQTRKVWPRSVDDFWIHGHPLISPVTGQVSAASDGADDQALGASDRTAPLGNHVCIQCDDPEFGRIEVCLAHLRKGSVSVAKGDVVKIGQLVGEIGNSGNSSDPHLHIHAHRPDGSGNPLSGEPVPFRFQGVSMLRRNRVFTVSA
ncbi:M23 family metallopeptidase [Rhodobacteraceae bacterium B1Z28]|uniref:M23 family metallopeptidase n=1 Tax=Ruegeria haliotis TaxID=2747601 RepID=A0ABX2PVY9_9RHOB|nr:M23 family metallopeptidase [Ruegeria haliotis]NVO58360.1 M23 family metallopeptidase [Ruegeria haliotis]